MKFRNLGLSILLSLSFTNAAMAFEGKENTYAALLASGNNDQIVMAAESLFYEKSTNTELLDIVAELMWRGSKEELYISSDGLSWLAKTLGQSKLSRYKPILQKVDANMAILEERDKPAETWGIDEEEDDEPVTQTRRGDGPVRPKSGWNSYAYASIIDEIHVEVNHTKVRNYIEDVLELLTIESSETFVEGSVDQKALLERIEKYKKANYKDRQEITISNIKRGDYISDVYAKLGLPDRESVFYIRKSKAFVGQISLAWLQIRYGDQGSIQFSREDGDKPGWYVFKVYSFQPEGLMAKLASDDAAEVKKVGHYIFKTYVQETEILDVLAKRIWKSMHTDDPRLADSIAWLCKGIGNSRHSRYLTFMQEVAKNAQSNKVKGYARKQLKLLQGGNAPQYLSYKENGTGSS